MMCSTHFVSYGLRCNLLVVKLFFSKRTQIICTHTEGAAYLMCNLSVMSPLLWFLGRVTPGMSVGSFVHTLIKNVLVR